jgi:hypothetical protein
VRSTVFALLTLASVALAASALGKDKEDRGHGRGGGPPDRVVVVPAPAAPARVVFSDRDRAVVYNYYRTQYVSVGRCPPGLAKKGYGCVPPGQVQVVPIWVIGQPLPPTVVYQPLPPPLAAQLPPPPPPYSYVQVDNDVLLMNTSNRMIADMITDLSDFD